MLTEERKAIILNEVNSRGSVTLGDLTAILGVSDSTIRRDVIELSREGRLLKVRGGAMRLELSQGHDDTAILGREASHKNQKIKIAEYAASLILPGEYVFIDAGSTTGFMIGFIKERKAIYVTNSVSHAADLVHNHFKVFLIGGEMRENTDVIVGADAILHIQKYNFNRGFFGTNGIDEKLGFTTNDVREALIKRVAMENTTSGKKFVLADKGKFGLKSAVTFADLNGVTVLTDGYPGDRYRMLTDIKVV
ncbi:MAG: DeoR/GlpR family DNA-binding transcription regulator [Eubacterium sp.]|nr:DeoR/GlpR family DNA-binding transcription regulator [Eubacterium sp.]